MGEKPDIYARIRQIPQAQNLTGASLGAVLPAILVQIIEFMCTSGFPALYPLAYMFDDIIILAIGIITLSRRRLQEKEGRQLKLVTGLVMVGISHREQKAKGCVKLRFFRL